MGLFKDRFEAGRRLALELGEYTGNKDVLVLALPRGGVPVAYEVARILNVPMDLFIVRKLGVPGHEELAFGAIADNNILVLKEDIIRPLGITEGLINYIIEREKNELIRRNIEYRDNKPQPVIKDKIIVLIDDGLATGASMQAAVEALQQMWPRKIIVAVPTASPDTCKEFEDLADQVICVATPYPFRGVGFWYEDFSQIQDDEVKDILKKAEEFPVIDNL